jgi:high-affinity iron transporter
MFSAGLVTFREVLEVALVVGIIITFLTRTKQFSFKKYVWMGVGIGALLSITLAFILQTLFGGFEGKTEEIFEGVLMFVTAGFLTWMILWVHRQKGVAKKIESQVQQHIASGFPLGLFFLTLTSVMREGVETVFYLRAISVVDGQYQIIGAILGAALAIGLGFAIFKFSMHVNLTRLLKISGAFLLLFAAGLVSHGVHEFQEVGLMPVFSFDPLINITHVLDHNSTFGSILRTLFGYTAKPTLLELIAYASYIFMIFLLEIFTARLLALRYLVHQKK